MCIRDRSNNALFDVFIKTTPNTAWNVGLTGFNGNPATVGCNGVSPKALWTQIKTGSVADNLRATPITQTSLDTLCLLYTSDAADERSSVDLGGRRIIKKKNNTYNEHVRKQKQ